MTPLDCAKGLADYLREQFKVYSETATYTMNGTETRKPVDVYAGFLPRASRREDMQALCPAIVLRPDTVEDGAEGSSVSLVAYATVYDEDMRRGSDSLYHMVELIRFLLLSENPVCDRWQIKPGMKITVPDDQPFPQWLGVVEFEVILPEPIWTPRSINGEVLWKRKETRSRRK